MSTQIAVANPAYLPPNPEILGPELVPVQEYDQELHTAAKYYRISTMRIAYYGHRMRMVEGWQAFGYEAGPRGEEQYRESLGVPRTTWYRACRIGQAFHQLSLPELEQIPIGNAEMLLAVNPLLIHDYNWVQEARTKSQMELAELVASRNRTIGDKREPLTAMIFRVPVLARKAIDQMLTTFQRRHELSSKSQALELLVADKHDAANLLAAAYQAKQLVTAAAETLRRKKEWKDSEAVAWMVMAAEVLDEAYKKEVQGSREAAEGVQGDGGRP